METGENYRYQELATYILDLINKGVLSPGAKAPSLREVGKIKCVSVSTALHAYRLLEDKGVLEAKFKSGFYVSKGFSMSRLDEFCAFKSQGNDVELIDTLQLEIGNGQKGIGHPNAVPENVVNLGLGTPSTDVLARGQFNKFLSRVLRSRGAALNSYISPFGIQDLRQEIAYRSLRLGNCVALEDVAITYGCTESLSLALQTVTSPADQVIIESPTYFGLLRILESLNLRPIEVPTTVKDGLDLSKLEDHLKSNCVKVCVLSSNISNPSGCSMPSRRKVELLGLLEQYGVVLIEDDVNGDLFFGEDQPKPFISLSDYEDIIYCSSFSKTVGPGCRTGWVVSRKYIKDIVANKIASNVSGSALIQTAMADFLSEGGYDNYLRGLRRVFYEALNLSKKAVQESFPAGTRCSNPKGGYLLWVEMPNGICSREVLSESEKYGIRFLTGDLFCAEGARLSNCLRLSCGSEWVEEIGDAIRLVGAIARRVGCR